MLYNPTKILPEYNNCNIDNFRWLRLTNRNKVQKTIKSFLEKQNQWLFFVGETGRGKTHIAVAIYKELCDKFLNAGRGGLEIEWWDRLINRYNENDIKDIILELSLSKVLIIDDITKLDLDKKIGYNYKVIDMLKLLINNCFDNNTILVTTSNIKVTKNMSADNLLLMLGGDEYLLSRISSKTIFVPFIGEDYRETEEYFSRI